MSPTGSLISSSMSIISFHNGKVRRQLKSLEKRKKNEYLIQIEVATEDNS